MAIRLVLFDCDGTLVDSQQMIVRAMNTAFESQDLQPPSRQETLSVVGRSLNEAISDLTGGAGPISEISEAYRSAFFSLRSNPSFREPLYEGANECIQILSERDDILLGVATGKSRRGLNAVLEHHGLADCFVTLQTADNARSKPDPEMVQLALKETGIEPESCVMIGDTSHDMQMALNAGVQALGVSWGYHSVAALMRSGAEQVFDSFQRLQNHLATN